MEIDYNKDYYSVLGVDKKATKEDIAAAYRKLMLQWHPDRFASKGKEEQEAATKKSAEINEAYDILGDDEKRREYDMGRDGRFRRFGSFNNDTDPFANWGGFGFSGFHPFSGQNGFRARSREDRTPTTGRRIAIQVELPFEDFFFGCTKTLDIKVAAKCDNCDGGIVGGGSPEYAPCPHCDGKGFSSRVVHGLLIQEMCPHCGGVGSVLKNACPHCGGSGIGGKRVQTVKFEVPKDTRGTWSQTYEGVGNAGPYGGACGDICVEATMWASGMFYPMGGNDLGTVHFVNVFKAIAGGYETILTPYGEKNIMLPSEMPDGYHTKFYGMGLKGKNGEPDGDLYVKFKMDLPKGLSPSEMRAVTKLASKFDNSPAAFPNVLSEKGYAGIYLTKLRDN